MQKLPISFEICLVLKAINESNSLRAAAELLQCDPAGLVRKIQVIATESNLVKKHNNRWQLTEKGLRIVAWTEECLISQGRVLGGNNIIRFASTMWFSEQILVPAADKISDIFNSNTELRLSVPDKKFELALIEGSADYVVVCHPPESPDIEHRKITAEEWIIIYPKIWQRKGHKIDSFLLSQKFPFIRHSEMNLDLFLNEEPKKFSSLQLDNLIGIRSAVSRGIGWSMVPKLLIQSEIYEISNMSLSRPVADRHVCLWWLRQRADLKRQAPRVIRWLEEACSSNLTTRI